MTIYKQFRQTAEQYPENQVLGWLAGGAYQTITYAELSEKARMLAAGFARQGLARGDKILFMFQIARNGI